MACVLKRHAMGSIEKEIETMLNAIKAAIIIGSEIVRYHCNKMPATKGSNSLMKGAVFQIGME